MNIEELKKACTHAKNIIMDRSLVCTSDLAELISAYEGSQFAAASHLNTVKTQQRIIAGYQAREKLSAELIAAFESCMTGCRNKSWKEWQNGDGENVGERIEAARKAYHSGEPA